MAKEYIERNEAIKELRDVYEFENPTASGAFDEYATMLVPRILKNLPTADVAEVKHAAWKWGKVCGQEGIYCTNCQAGWVNSDKAEWIAHEHDYCPKCGAKMDLKEGAEK